MAQLAPAPAGHYSIGRTASAAKPVGRGPRGRSGIELRDVRLARYLDRPDPVRAAGGTRLMVEDGRRWAGPLDEMIAQVLSQDLEQRLPGSTVLRELGALAGEPELEVGVAPTGQGTNALIQALGHLADRMVEVFST